VGPATGGHPEARPPGRPFGPGSVSFRVYPHNELAAEALVAELCDQAALALAAGFDGVMTSEHHGGFPGYLPNPLQAAGFILAVHPDGWVAPCPLLLPLRPTALVAEEAAWLAARYPGRVGLGVAAGALALDFSVMGLDPAGAGPRFAAALPDLVDLLSGRRLGELAGDPALRRCAGDPVPVLSAAASVTAARRAAGCGAGILLEGLSEPARLAPLCAAHAEAGGTGSRVLIRRAWLGRPDPDLITGQRRVYAGYTPGALPPDQTVAAGDPDELAARLAGALAATGADALNLRVHLPGMAPAVVRHQIEALGLEVVPRLRKLLAG
jgi:alkanesulfonate monooxygenase SsuD/methylene tetrahydromethanopterin reductase-like flavin-dependent oxidoreductase (luciferase family)